MDIETAQNSHWWKQLLAHHRAVLLAAAEAGRFVLVPQTCSLTSWTVAGDAVRHHVLEPAPGAPRGEFRTLSGRTAVVTATSVVTGAGFAARVEATILAASTIAVELPPAAADVGTAGGARRQGRLQLYFLSRPLEGGLAAPSSVDELTADGIRKYLALLRSAPDVDACFEELEEGVGEIARGLAARRGAAGEGAAAAASGNAAGGSAISTAAAPLPPPPPPPPLPSDAAAGAATCEVPAQLPRQLPLPPPLAASAAAAAASACANAELALRVLCESVCEQALDSATFEDDSDEAFARSRQQVSQCLESWCAERLHDVAIAALRDELAGDVAQLRASLARAAGRSQADLGIKPAFRCDFSEVARLLAELPRRRTPLEKLHCVRDASLRARALVERHLEAARVDLAEVDFGADDELPILAHAILLLDAEAGAGNSAGAELPVHLAFCQRFRLQASGELELSQLGYRLANLEQALGYFREGGEGAGPS
jgi:hypothetical protein